MIYEEYMIRYTTELNFIKINIKLRTKNVRKYQAIKFSDLEKLTFLMAKSAMIFRNVKLIFFKLRLNLQILYFF